MPSLIIQAPHSPAAVVAEPQPQVFISYSHEDSRLAAKFVQFFFLFWRELGFDPGNVFYDARRLQAGYTWEDPLLRALSQANFLILLVSENSLVAGGYCMEREVRTAARAGIPIVPVVLTQCPWQRQQIPDDPLRRTLGSVGALPLSANRDVKPVTHWTRRDQAWAAVIEGLRQILAGTVGGATAAPPVACAPVIRTDLLAYLCNQESTTGGFDGGLEAWDARALVVLVKGIFDDNPARFWERLRLEHLAQFLAAHPSRGALLGLDKPLILPVKDGGSGSPAGIRRTILHEISYTLTGNRFSVGDAAGLAAAMEAFEGTIALLAMPAVDSVAALKNALEGLLSLIDEVPAESVLKRTVIAVNLEFPGLAQGSLAARWKLGRFKRSLLVELDPLTTVTPNDAHVWYVHRRIAELFRVSEDRITALFGGDEALRMRVFDSRLQPLFGA